MAQTKYDRKIVGFGGEVVTIDVYRVLDAFHVTDPQLQHLIKKALCAGLRGHKSVGQDLIDIRDSAARALTMHNDKNPIER